MKAVNIDKLLPADLPRGERVIWHGRPQWVGMARRAFRVDFVAAWFGLMSAWNFSSTASSTGWTDAVLSAGKTLGAGALALGLLSMLAWLSCRTTLYVVTSRRVVMKVGIALPIFFNLPFATIKEAALREYADETGDIALGLGPDERIAYLHLWPHARPFRLKRPEPALRAVANAASVAEKLSRALIEASNAGVEQEGSIGKTAEATINLVVLTGNAVAAA